MQRFISEDPIGFAGGINFYAYVTNSPMMFRDPSGLYGDGLPGTLQVGINLSGIYGIGTIVGGAGIAIDTSGNIAPYYEYGGGGAVGAGVSGGISITGTNARTVDDLKGLFANGSIEAGYGFDGSINATFGQHSNDNSPIVGGGVTIGLGGGGGAAATVTNTVMPFGSFNIPKFFGIGKQPDFAGTGKYSDFAGGAGRYPNGSKMYGRK